MPHRMLALALFALLPNLADVARAEEPATTFRGFLPSGVYTLVLDGQAVDASIYRSESAPAYLVLSESLPHGVILLPRRRCADSVAANEVVRQEDGSLSVRMATVECRYGPFVLERTDIVFRIGEREARLRPKPALTGRHDARAVLAHTPEYARAAEAYTPNAEMVRTLRGATRDVQVVVFFGTWCSFCTRFLPHTLRLERELTGSKIHFAYHGLQPPPAAWITEDAVKHGVRKLLTGIVYVDGREIGRIVGNDWIQPERSLLPFVR